MPRPHRSALAIELLNPHVLLLATYHILGLTARQGQSGILLAERVRRDVWYPRPDPSDE
jgi:hypothetical protein